jgi:Uma2 family endonuclease
MRQYTHEGTGRQPELTGREKLMGNAPTEPEAFLRWSAQRSREEGKFELSRGRVVRNMTYASNHHSRVLRNLVLEIGHFLDPDRFDIGISDFAVQMPYGVRSPDVVIGCTAPRRELSTTTPIFIVEVLSPSTAGRDFTEKLQEYTAIETLRTYLICSRDEPRAWVWARRGNESWPDLPEQLVGRDGSIAPGGLDIELAMAAIFRGIPDAPTVE